MIMKLVLICLLAILSISRAINLGKFLEAKVYIDPNRKYLLGWEVDHSKDVIVFEVEVETNGYVGFGISPSGSMVGADIFIAGINNGLVYFGDYHGLRNGQPIEDSRIDWDILRFEQNATHTFLTFSRLLNTCDDQDYPIGNDTNRLIWAIGASHELNYHVERGTYSANLLLPEEPFDGSQFIKHDIVVNTTMPEQDTTYWCTIHEGPVLDKKHHIVAFEPFLPSLEAVEHTHHIILIKCIAPEGQDPEDLFGKLVGDPGNHCYLGGEDQHLPTQYCQAQIFAWAKGGKRMVFPENVGYPIGTGKQYYMMEVHYDNPRELEGVKFETGLRSYLTSELRINEANNMMVSSAPRPSLTVPPETGFVVAGHCPSECTAFFPQEGVTVFNVLLHAHLSGRRIKLRQFRNGVEIPWLGFDDHYDFNYQQSKPVQERKILPGDHLTLECNYSSTWKGNGEAVTGGMSTRDEMCETFIWYWPSNSLELCLSSYPLDQGFQDLGYTKYHLVDSGNGRTNQYYMDEPEELSGPFLESVSYKLNWTEESKAALQEKRRFGEHEFVCGSLSEGNWLRGEVQYVEAEDYTPVDECEGSI